MNNETSAKPRLRILANLPPRFFTDGLRIERLAVVDSSCAESHKKNELWGLVVLPHQQGKCIEVFLHAFDIGFGPSCCFVTEYS